MWKKKILLFLFFVNAIILYSQEINYITDTISNDIYEVYAISGNDSLVRQGKCERFYKDNLIMYGEYGNGQRTGNWILFNGKNFRTSGNYRNHKKEGDWCLIKGRDTLAVISYKEDEAVEIYTPHDKKGSKASSKSIDEKTISTLDNMPVFEGGNYDKYRAYINNNIEFPKVEGEIPAEGTIYVEFIINEIGQTQDVKILKGVANEYDAEALKIIKNSPPWIPGIKDGEPVKVKFIFPIVFKL